MRKRIELIISVIMYVGGFIMYCVFLNFNKGISEDAWLNTVGACLGVLLFCMSSILRE